MPRRPGDRRCLGLGLLDAVLAEDRQPGGHRGPDPRPGNGFRDGDERHGRRVAPDAVTGVGDPSEDVRASLAEPVDLGEVGGHAARPYFRRRKLGISRSSAS